MLRRYIDTDRAPSAQTRNRGQEFGPNLGVRAKRAATGISARPNGVARESSKAGNGGTWHDEQRAGGGVGQPPGDAAQQEGAHGTVSP